MEDENRIVALKIDGGKQNKGRGKLRWKRQEKRKKGRKLGARKREEHKSMEERTVGRGLPLPV